MQVKAYFYIKIANNNYRDFSLKFIYKDNVMKKFLIILIVFAIIGLGAYFLLRNNDNSNYSAQRTSYEDNTTNNVTSEPKIKEIQISAFSTPLKSKASDRQTNIQITCSTLNGTIVKSGETFSFCSTIGPSTSEKGYQKADIIVHGKKEKGLGGGNCQVSSTLYNAVLAVPELTVTERHEHGKPVTYVEQGKDAAVSYGSMDLKFVNNLDTDIKITSSTDGENVYAEIYKITEE